jgi:hypothetical protein
MKFFLQLVDGVALAFLAVAAIMFMAIGIVFVMSLN